VDTRTARNALSLAPDGDFALPQNHLLRSLPPHEWERLCPRLQRVSLTPRRVLQHAGVPIDHIYFIEDGLVSVLASADEKSPVEVWLIGREGLAGSAALLGVRISPLRHFVQIGGSALRIGVEDFEQALAQLPCLRATLNNYLHAVLLQSAQAAACGLSHSLRQRLARWLLMAQDRSERDALPITQDLLARSLGVRRATVSEALKPLVCNGIFARERGIIKILDRRRLEEFACRCYRLMRPKKDAGDRNGRGRFYALSAFLALVEIELLAA